MGALYSLHIIYMKTHVQVADEPQPSGYLRAPRGIHRKLSRPRRSMYFIFGDSGSRHITGKAFGARALKHEVCGPSASASKSLSARPYIGCSVDSVSLLSSPIDIAP